MLRHRNPKRLCALFTALTMAVGVAPTAALADLDAGEVKTENIENGAVTFAKLAPDAVLMTTIVVSPVGPTLKDNCLELLAALDSITVIRTTEHYVIYLEPGVYDCAHERVVMKDHVHLRGAGPLQTHIWGYANGLHGVVTLASNSELRDLTVVSREPPDGKFLDTAAIGTNETRRTQSWRLTNVSLRALGAKSRNIGVFLGSHISCGGEMTNVKAETGTVGLEVIAVWFSCQGGKIRASNLTTQASKGLGVRLSGPVEVTILNSMIHGSLGLFVDPSPRAVHISEGSLTIFNSQLDGSLSTAGTGFARCINSYDENYFPLGRDCDDPGIFTPVLGTK
ncbi:MAG: hypothetical protein AAF495_14035 [Pseudomonadota bacterium]